MVSMGEKILAERLNRSSDFGRVHFFHAGHAERTHAPVNRVHIIQFAFINDDLAHRGQQNDVFVLLKAFAINK